MRHGQSTGGLRWLLRLLLLRRCTCIGWCEAESRCSGVICVRCACRCRWSCWSTDWTRQWTRLRATQLHHDDVSRCGGAAAGCGWLCGTRKGASKRPRRSISRGHAFEYKHAQISAVRICLCTPSPTRRALRCSSPLCLPKENKNKKKQKANGRLKVKKIWQRR